MKNEEEMLISDLIARFKDRGYVVEPLYCFAADGTLVSVRLNFTGRLE